MKNLLIALGATALGLSGCGVYAPYIPATPVVERGQVEMKLSLAPLRAIQRSNWNDRKAKAPPAEGYLALSPLPHVLAVISGGSNFANAIRPDVTRCYRERQADVGLGYYTRPSGAWYVAGLAGIGWGHTDLSYRESSSGSFFSIGGSSPHKYTTQYAAPYRRIFVQAYAVIDDSTTKTKFCFFGRFTQLNYYDEIRKTRLRDAVEWQQSAVPVNAIATGYLEPGWSLRVGGHAWQLAVEAGLSIPLQRPRAGADEDELIAPSRTLMMTVGVVYRPQLWGKRSAVNSPPKKSSPD